MEARACKIAMCLTLLGFLCGCESFAKPVFLHTANVEPKLAYSDLAAVLKGAVNEDGLLIPDALKKRSKLLDRQLSLLQVTGPIATPKQLPTEEDRVAYWYNARASWAMKLSLVYDFPKRFSRRALAARQFTLDGRQMSLAQIDEVLAGFDDWRIEVAAPGVTLSRARLPVEPFEGRSIRRQIPKRLNEFVYDRRRFVIDVLQKQILVPPVLWQLRRRLICSHEETYGAEGANLTTALLPYLEGGPMRRLQDAVGYRVIPARRRPLSAFLIEDWRIGL